MTEEKQVGIGALSLDGGVVGTPAQICGVGIIPESSHFCPRHMVSTSSPEPHRFYGSPLGTVWGSG